jgi:voltage-gated potassium channel Kch
MTRTLDTRYIDPLEGLALAVEPFALHAVRCGHDYIVPALDYDALMAARAAYLRAMKYAPRPVAQPSLFEDVAA